MTLSTIPPTRACNAAALQHGGEMRFEHFDTDRDDAIESIELDARTWKFGRSVHGRRCRIAGVGSRWVGRIRQVLESGDRIATGDIIVAFLLLLDRIFWPHRFTFETAHAAVLGGQWP